MSNARKAAPTAAQKKLAAQRSAAARERIKRTQRRRQLYTVIGAVVAVVVVIGVLVIVRVASGGPSSKGTKSALLTASQSQQLQNVPSSVLDQVGTGTVIGTPQKIDGPALTSNGKPEVFYAGAEYCPYCAAERWAFVVATSRFGTWTKLGSTTSSAEDSPPSLATLTFHGASYSGKYFSITAKELETNTLKNGTYTPLDKLTGAETTLLRTYDTSKYVGGSGNGGIPFIDYGGKYAQSGATYANTVLIGLSHDQIIADINNPSSKVGQAIDGAANGLTATLCQVTGQQPASVCSSTGVKAAAAKLPTQPLTPTTSSGSSAPNASTLSPSAG